MDDLARHYDDALTAIQESSGSDLDEIGKVLGRPRVDWEKRGLETDEEYRQVLTSTLFREYGQFRRPRQPACECGSDKAGGIGHSHWCPKFKEM